MTAIQLLEKLGANASFNPNHLSKEDKSSIEQAVSTSKTFTAVQLNTQPNDDEETPEENDDDDKESKKEN